MENTLENKAKFFALYWGQDVLTYGVNNIWHKGNVCGRFFNISHLELKPLSSISDEDFLIVAQILLTYLNEPLFKLSRGYSEGIIDIPEDVICLKCSSLIEIEGFQKYLPMALIQIDTEENDIITGRFENDGKQLLDDHSDNILHAYDYLRSRGYALPCMGLSVEELVNRGWIKLKEFNDFLSKESSQTWFPTDKRVDISELLIKEVNNAHS